MRCGAPFDGGRRKAITICRTRGVEGAQSGLSRDDKILSLRQCETASIGRIFKESQAMAVQQNKKSPSKRGMHRAHDFLPKPPLAVEPVSGEVHLRHHISPSGYYRGKKVVKTKADE
jgi:large subunit ribosomal protein L32